MRTRTRVLRRDGVQALRYAAIFGGILSLMLALANLERPAHPFGLSHTPAQVSQ